MCNKCDEFDNKICRYRGYLNQPFDELTIEGIKALILDLEKRKAALHRESSEL